MVEKLDELREKMKCLEPVMTPKRCRECKVMKSIGDFYWSRRDKIFGSQCKECKSKRYKKRYAADPQLFLTRNKRWTENNPEKARDIIKRWAENNPANRKASIEKYKNKYPERLLVATLKWNAKNPDKLRKAIKKSNDKRYANLKGKISSNMSCGIRRSLVYGAKGKQHWENLVGYTAEQLKKHLENCFTPEMSWENYGKYWEIDHKIPIAAFNFEHPEDIDFHRCWAISNLQPLEASENVRKHAKVDRPFQPSLAICSFVGGVASERMRKGDPPKE